jgi:hypothetical protein
VHLTEKEVERFYNIWFPLLHFVNQQLQVVPSFPKQWRNANVPPDVAVPVREALWEHDVLREVFIAENPANLAPADLSLIDSWKYRIPDNFFVFRHLKKHTIFIDSSSPAHGYGVLGITSALEEIFGPYLPIYVQAVLLPFEERIIYDSLLSSYPIHFGQGIRGSLKDTYRGIQERGGIISQLPHDHNHSDKKRIQAGNKKLLTAFQKSLGAAGLSPKMIQQHTGNLTDFATELLNERTPPQLLLDLTNDDIKTYRKSRGGDLNPVSFKRFVRFLRDTGRMNWEEAEALLYYLKQL